MTLHLNYRGAVAVIMAAALAVVLIVLVGAAASGVAFSEFGRDAGWAILGALAGALITYMAATSSNGSKPPTGK